MDPNDAPTDILNDDQNTPPEGDPPKPTSDGDGAPDEARNSSGDETLDKDSTADSKSDAAGDVLSDDDDAAQEGVPDQYTFEVPDDLGELQIDETKLEAFKETAKELGFTQDQFQKVVEYDLQRQQEAVQEAVDGWNQRVSGWREAARTDKEFGGENYDANVKTAMSAVQKFADPEFKALLKSPSDDNPDGLAIGNHPAVLRFLNRIGKALSDPSLIMGDDVTQSSDVETRLKRMYPSMYKDSAN